MPRIAGRGGAPRAALPGRGDHRATQTHHQGDSFPRGIWDDLYIPFYTSAMALNLKNAEADSLARELAGVTGETITEAIVVALRERLERQRPEGRRAARLERLVA